MKTLSEFIVERQAEYPNAKGELSGILSSIRLLAKIIHRDIKVSLSKRNDLQPENILCKDSLFDVKIGDFGLSKLVFPDEKLDYPCGTLNYIGRYEDGV